MKLCKHHESKIRDKLWSAGVRPYAPDIAAKMEKAGLGVDPFTAVRQLLLTNVAATFPNATLSAPADECPFCRGAPKSWIKKACRQIAWEHKAGTLGGKPIPTPSESLQ